MLFLRFASLMLGSLGGRHIHVLRAGCKARLFLMDRAVQCDRYLLLLSIYGREQTINEVALASNFAPHKRTKEDTP